MSICMDDRRQNECQKLFTFQPVDFKEAWLCSGMCSGMYSEMRCEQLGSITMVRLTESKQARRDP